MYVNGHKVMFAVNDNTIEPIGKLSEIEMFQVYNRIRKDLVDSQIPVIKPIAFKICTDKSDVIIRGGAVNIIDAIGVAPIDIGFELDRQLIISKPGGRMFGGEDAQSKNNSLYSDLTFLYISKSIGGCGVQYSNVLNSTVESICEPDFGLFIGDNKISMNVICAKGTGEWNFNDAMNVSLNGTNSIGQPFKLGRNISDYFTINTHFTLSEYVKLIRYVKGDSIFRFHIAKPCNSGFLSNILLDYLMSDDVSI